MKLTKDEARAVVWDETDDWEAASPKEIIDTTRWSNVLYRVFRHIPTGKFYEFSWSVGATEMQDERPYEYEDEITPEEVVQEVVTVTKWVRLNNKGGNT